ncbi:MAG: glycosyltransferase, partial [Dorea sp.]|nr:glycosyltransferase [Dorea sp.]
MKILMVNVVCGIRSTGRICTDLAYALKQSGNEVKIAYGRKQAPAEFQDMSIRVGNGIDNLSHAALSRLFDAQGYGSVRATKKFIKWVEEYNPDIIHLHNIHGYYLNIKFLFDFLKKRDKPVVWTLHDMWAFTGHAAFCVGVPCFRYIEGCFDCPRKKAYPESLLDRSELNWRRKRNLIRSLTKLNIVVPSYWLADITKKSFLGIYPIHVIHNGVDTKNFKPVKHDIREKYGIKKEKIALGVAAIWDERKGLMDLVELSQKLHEEYQFIVVGLTNRQMESLPSNIIGIQHTNSVQELAELYSAADVFVNPTY